MQSFVITTRAPCVIEDLTYGHPGLCKFSLKYNRIFQNSNSNDTKSGHSICSLNIIMDIITVNIKDISWNERITVSVCRVVVEYE